MKKYILFILSIVFLTTANAQMWSGGGGMGGAFKGKSANVGHFYGKVIDSATGKGIPFAAVQLSGPKWDTASKSMKTGVIAVQVTGDNGEFSLEKLPVMGPFTLEISSIGYGAYKKTVGFNLSKLMNGAKKMQGQQNGSDNGDMNSTMSSVTSMINAVDKDLGNIKLKPDATQLQTVTINGSPPPVELKMDKKVFDVSKQITTAGGTAEDVLRTIPSVNVDIDGNVTLRNANPTIYVDGMPTSLTIDQIPADEIDKIEVITNPSAKYDASASSGGIINIILKKNHTSGYNGSIRAGVDQRGKMNGGLDINIRQNKINIFGSLFYHQIDHYMHGITDRYNLTGTPLTNITQDDSNFTNGHFLFARAGVDYFIDNRNTITLSGMKGQGVFQPQDYLDTYTDTVNAGKSSEFRNSQSQRTFGFTSGTLSYKHLFPKEDEELTANVEFNQGMGGGSATYATTEYNAAHNVMGPLVLSQQTSNSVNNEGSGQIDYSDPITKKLTFKTGVRVNYNQVNSQSTNSIFNYVTNEYQSIQSLNTNYTFSQQVYAAYAILSQDVGSRFSYMAGLRVESSFYSGKYADSTNTFTNQYPFSLFPSAYATYHLTDKSDLQLNYSRHITRPSFYQLVPYTDYSDSLNIKRGNPALLPEFINSFEFNYINNFSKRNMFMGSLYFKNMTGIITTYQQLEYSSFLNKDVVINTYENANYANSYGAELTSQNSIGQWLDITANVNLYQSSINGENLGANLSNQLVSWFAKLNLTFKLPWDINLQVNGSYQSKAVIPVSQGEGRWGGYGMSTTPTSQGYILPTYSADVALKKDFLKNKALSITMNVRDIFATAVTASTSSTTYFNQDVTRYRDAQFFRFTISYRFGQMDFSLFKKKNLNEGGQPQDVGGGGGDMQ